MNILKKMKERIYKGVTIMSVFSFLKNNIAKENENMYINTDLETLTEEEIKEMLDENEAEECE